MQRLGFINSIIMIASLIASCTANAEAQVNRMPTATSEKAEPSIAPEIFSRTPPVDCPRTTPPDPPFIPPPPYDHLGFEGEFWIGTDTLWTAVRENGIWEALPHNPEGYTQKVFWWSEGYDLSKESEPALAVTAERLDAKAPAVQRSKATNASASDIGTAMLVGVDLPNLGCWKITGKYRDAELSFVVWVAP